MGYTFIHNSTKESIVQECTLDSSSHFCVRYKLVDTELWTIWQDRNSKEKSIVLFLIEKSGHDYGYKDIHESEGPYYYKVPLNFFDIVPVHNQNWRDQVLLYNARKKKLRNLIPGIVVKLTKEYGEVEMKLVSISPLIGHRNERDWSLTRSMIMDVIDYV